MNLQQLDKFHKTRAGHAVFALIELLMAYGFGSWAIDTGNLLWWVVTAFLLLGVVQNIFRVIWSDKVDGKAAK